MNLDNKKLSRRDKLLAVYEAATFRPLFATVILLLSILAALLEGIGLSFVFPIIEIAQGTTNPENASGALGVFVLVYNTLGVPFTLGYLVVGVAVAMTARFTSSFLVAWFSAAIENYYVRHLQQKSFENALDAKIAYFDQQGSDEILNAIVTQSKRAGRVIRYTIDTVEKVLLSLMYIAIALYIAPALTIGTAVAFGLLVFIFQYVLEGGYSVGDRVADANEQIQEAAQEGTQGIRDVKLYGLSSELQSKFQGSIDQFTSSQIDLNRNQAVIDNFYELATAVMIFTLIYMALTFSTLSLGALGVFLFAMFRLGPKISHLNSLVYGLKAQLPHLVRTQQFVETLEQQVEPKEGERNLQGKVHTVSFDNVTFAYETADQPTLDEISFSVDTGEFIAFVGPSGAGKSTIVSLLARFYTPESGEITADGVPIDNFDIQEWRSRISTVRQNPHIFNDTLRRNVNVGDRDADQSDIERACEVAQVTEFLDELPRGYDTTLGDDGVKLSGGQRQRVAIARALLKDADLLILDEATSDLDSNLEQRVHDGVEALERDYTILVIAHRLSTVTNADRIYTMEAGSITEVGPHNELLDNEGTYAELYDTQTRMA